MKRLLTLIMILGLFLPSYAFGVKVSEMTALTTVASGDLFMVVDISPTPDVNKKITWLELMAAPGPIGGTTPAAASFSVVDLLMAATDPIGIEIDGTTNDYTGADAGITALFQRDINRGTGAINNYAGWQSYLLVKHTDATITGDYFTYGNITRVNNTGKVTIPGGTDRQLWEVGAHNTSKNEGDFDTDGAGKFAYKTIGTYSLAWGSNFTIYDTGTGSPANVFEAHGEEILVQNTPSALDGTAAATINNVGVYIDSVLGNSVGTSTGYGIYINDVSGSDTNWGLYDATGQDWYTLGSLDMNPSGTAASTIIDITPSAAILSPAVEWDGINIDGAALDPGASAVDVEIHGIHVDMSGVLRTRLPDVEAIHAIGTTATATAGEKEPGLAVHADGKIRVDFDATRSIAELHLTAIEVVIDTDGATAGEIHGIDFSSGGGGTPEIYAVAAHPGVGVIEQYTGSFGSPGANYAGRQTGGGATYVDNIDAQSVFVAADDTILVGATTTFTEIEIILTTAATFSIAPKFYFNTAANSWTEFFPADGTDGMQNDGLVRFSAPGGWTNDGDPDQGGGSGSDVGYWIKIERNRNGTVGSPVIETAKILSAATFTWASDGDLSVKEVTVSNAATSAGSVFFKEDSDNGSNTAQLIGPASTADVVLTLQAITGTVYSSGGTDIVVADGGSGAGTFTDGGLLLGATTGAFEVTAVGAAGEILVGVAASNPKWLGAGTSGYMLVAAGASDPVWTQNTGTGAPVRGTSPTITGLTATLGAVLTVNEQTFLIDAALASDHTWTGPTQSVQAGEELTIGEIAYLKSDGKYWLTDADAVATAKGKIVMATATIAAEGTGIVLLPSALSFFRDDSTTEWTVNAVADEMYIDTVTGQIDYVAPSASVDIIRVVGYMETATVLNFVVGATYVEVD